LGAVTGAWAIYVQYSNVVPLCSSPCNPGLGGIGSPTYLEVIGAILLLDSLVSFTGFRATFILAAVLSAVLLLRVLLLWSDFPSTDSASVAVLSIVTIALDAVASRPAKALSEKDSPLNLPVFG
jgi:glycerol uptake facilitator-like aquaporin